MYGNMVIVSTSKTIFQIWKKNEMMDATKYTRIYPVLPVMTKKEWKRISGRVKGPAWIKGGVDARRQSEEWLNFVPMSTWKGKAEVLPY